MKAVGEYRGKQELFQRQTPEVMDSLRELAIIESSESSNRLEGITAPRKRVRALVAQTTTPTDRSEQEIAEEIYAGNGLVHAHGAEQREGKPDID